MATSRQTVAFSIKDADKPQAAVHEEETQFERRWKEPFEYEQLSKAWVEYLSKLKEGEPSKATVLGMTKLVLKENFLVECTFNSNTAKTEFVEHQEEIMQHLRSSLKNDFIRVELLVVEDKRAKHVLTKKDKFEKMLEINPDLIVLKELFDLDIYD